VYHPRLPRSSRTPGVRERPHETRAFRSLTLIGEISREKDHDEHSDTR
jgi:hypothetical protein